MTRRVVVLLQQRWLHMLFVAALYLALLLPAVNRQGISWDEQTDLTIAQAYLDGPDGWLAGSPIDPSQTRLPHFTVALVTQILGNTSLLTARLVSVVVGLATLLGVYVYCRQRFNHATGILAAGLLATSQFYLSFARVAFTETDIYLACGLVWLLVCLTRLQERPTIGRAALVGVVLGLSLSAKFTAVAVLPAVWIAVFQRKPDSQVPQAGSKINRQAVGVALWTLMLAAAGFLLPGSLLDTGQPQDLRFVLFAAFLAGWLSVLIWSVRNRGQTTGPVLQALWITGLGFLSFFLIPPEHLTNPAILQSLSGRLQHEMSYHTKFLLEAVALHLGSIWFKTGLLSGLGLLVSWVVAGFQWRRPEIRIPLLISLCYFGCLAILPIAQTFYTVPLLPFLSIFLADQFQRLNTHRRRVALGLAVIAAALWGVELIQAYPDFNLNGYQWIGAMRIMGRSSIGYRSIIQTPSDGVEQTVNWLNEHAVNGDIVRFYVLEWHIIHAEAPHPAYRTWNGLEQNKGPEPDYVVTEINTMIPQSWWTRNFTGAVIQAPYDPGWLSANYTKIFAVPRAFGVEMAAVWKRK